MNMLTKFYIIAMNEFNAFKNDERGVSPIIATTLILLFTVLMAVVFRDNLNTWFTQLWASISENKDELTAGFDGGFGD